MVQDPASIGHLGTRQHGGHNKVALEEVWIAWFRDGCSLNGARETFGISSSVAYRAQTAAQQQLPAEADPQRLRLVKSASSNHPTK